MHKLRTYVSIVRLIGTRAPLLVPLLPATHSSIKRVPVEVNIQNRVNESEVSKEQIQKEVKNYAIQMYT